MSFVVCAIKFICGIPIVLAKKQLGSVPHGTTLSAKNLKWCEFPYSPLPPKTMERYRSFPFKGKARMGMGSFATHYPIPTPDPPLEGEGACSNSA